ncbi:hypothetical protein DFP73DRAFT_560987 [Morchella snyderi]|nr:hypothetical protein DFP73DRAFT_560987 [Morchella snyderi]
MADSTDIPYSPPQYIVSRSLLDREQLIAEFECFKQSLHYISRAPEVVFERLIGNINEAVILRLSKQRAAQLAERQELEKMNEALKEKMANFDKITLRQKSESATELATVQKLQESNAALKEKVASLEAITSRQERERTIKPTVVEELEKKNAALKERVANLETITSGQENDRAIQLAELQEAKEKVEHLQRIEEINTELEAKLRVLEAEVQAYRIPRNPKDEYRDSVRTILETVINRIT